MLINYILTANSGVDAFDVNKEKQRVVVKSRSMTLEEAKAVIAKTGKEVCVARETRV